MEQEKSQKSLIVLILILILIVLGLGGYVVYDKFISKEQDDKPTTIIKEEALSLDSDEVKQLPNVVSFDNFDINDNDSLLKAVAYSIAKADEITSDGVENYFTVEKAKEYFNKMFGLQKEAKYSDIRISTFCTGDEQSKKTYEYNQTNNKFINSMEIDAKNQDSCLKDGAIVVYYDEAYKAIKKENQIELYLYVAQINDLRGTFNGTSPYCYVYSNGEKVFSSDTNRCAVDTISSLKKENKIKTYKVTYEKQTDGKYYAVRGEWQ